MNNDSRASIISEALRAIILAGQAGDALPSTRVLVEQFRASPVTVARAISQLVAAGLVRTEQGRGTFIVERPRFRAANYSWQAVALGTPRIEARRTTQLAPDQATNQIALTSGYLAPELQPRQALQAATARTGRRAETWDAAQVEGIPELRRLFSAMVSADEADAFVIPSAQSGLALLLRTLANPGSAVLVENPTYPGAIAAAQAAALIPVPVPTDEHGVNTALLDECFSRTGAKVFYVQPTFANPTGIITSPDRRRAILSIAHAHGAFVIEDDWARHLAFDIEAPKALITDDEDGHVIYLTSLSKPSAPSMRIGTIIARGPAQERIRHMRIANELFIARPIQETAVELLTNPTWARHLRNLRTILKQRRDLVRRELANAAPGLNLTSIPAGGLHLWTQLPHDVTATSITEKADQRGILVGNGNHFFANEASGEFIRLSFAGTSEPQLIEGIQRLGGLMSL